ncbi:MAG: tRNA (adenosine(37)-N6)-threonylcarbamoyltransferase complex dimerization subunit type 1 TsaB [Pseudomonadota bacterium]
MKLLAVNTAQTGCEVCVLTGRRTFIHGLPDIKGQDASLPGLVSDVCSQAGLSLSEVDRIAVVTGPGSFTGLRIGIAFARGLGLSLRRPVLGVTSLEAACPRDVATSVIVALKAKRRPPDQTWWTQIVQAGKGVSQPSELDVAGVEALAKSQIMDIVSDSPDTFASRFGTAAISAETAAHIATDAHPEERPAIAAYGRAPDAVLPRTP